MATVYWKGGNAGVAGSFTEGLTSKTLDNAAAVDNGDGTVNIPSATHTFILGDYVVIKGTANYDGNHLLVAIPDASTFTIVATYVSETFGGSETAKSSNWQDKDGVPVDAPVAADDMIFDSSAGIATAISKKHESGNHWNLCDNIAIGDTGELELASITIESSFTGNIGINAQYTISPLHMSIADNGHITVRGNGLFYIECSADDVTTTINIPLLIFDSASGYLQISTDTNDGTWKSEWDEVRCLNQGVLELAADTVVGAIKTFDSTTTIIIGANCTDDSDSNSPIDLYFGSSNIYATNEILSTISIGKNAIARFGANAVTIKRGR